MQTITQYDKICDVISGQPEMKGKNFCPFFSVITAANFLENRLTSRYIHEMNIGMAILEHSNRDFTDQMTFVDLMSVCNGKYTNKIQGVTTELLKDGLYDYREILPQRSEPYATILLKNGNTMN